MYLRISREYTKGGFQFVDSVFCTLGTAETHTLKDGEWININSGSRSRSELIKDELIREAGHREALESISANIEALNNG